MLKRKECNGKISNKCLSVFVKEHKQAVIEAGFGVTLYYDGDNVYSDDEDYFASFNYGNDDLSEDDDVYSSDSQDVDYIIN